MISGIFLISHEKGNTNKIEPQVLSHPLSIQIADVCKLRNARYGGTRCQVQVCGGVVCPPTPLTPTDLPISFLSQFPTARPMLISLQFCWREVWRGVLGSPPQSAIQGISWARLLSAGPGITPFRCIQVAGRIVLGGCRRSCFPGCQPKDPLTSRANYAP